MKQLQSAIVGALILAGIFLVLWLHSRSEVADLQEQIANGNDDPPPATDEDRLAAIAGILEWERILYRGTPQQPSTLAGTIAPLEQALRDLDGSDEASHLWRARALGNLRRFDEALESLDGAPNTPAVRLRRAMAHYERFRIDFARYQSLVATVLTDIEVDRLVAPHREGVLEALGDDDAPMARALRAYFERDNPAAFEAVQEAINQRTDSVEAMRLLGDILMSAGRAADALNAYLAALSQMPGCYEAHVAAGIAALRASRLPEDATPEVREQALSLRRSALGFGQNAARMLPDRSEGHILQAIARRFVLDLTAESAADIGASLDQQEIDWNAAINRDPDNLVARVNRSSVRVDRAIHLVRTQQPATNAFASAEEDLDFILQNREWSPATYMKALLQIAAVDTRSVPESGMVQLLQSARGLFEQIRTRHRDNDDVYVDSTMQSAAVTMRLGSIPGPSARDLYGEAARVLTEAIDRRQSDPDLLALRGQARLSRAQLAGAGVDSLSEFDLALADYRAAAEADAGNRNRAFSLAQAQLARAVHLGGRVPEQAPAAFAQAIDTASAILEADSAALGARLLRAQARLELTRVAASPETATALRADLELLVASDVAMARITGMMWRGDLFELEGNVESARENWRAAVEAAGGAESAPAELTERLERTAPQEP